MSGSRLDLNVTLAAKEAEAVPLGRDEKAALKRAEGAFRASRGYEPDTLEYRLEKKFWR